jgi:hypothetical protein
MKSPMTVQNMVRRRVRRRRAWRRLRVSMLVVLGLLAAGGAAFGIDRMVVSLQRYYASGPSHTGHTTVTTTTAPPVTAPPGPPVCVGGQLTGTVENWYNTGQTMYQIVELTNVSMSACTLQGYPGLAVNGANGTALPAATQDVATLGTNSGNGGSAGPGTGGTGTGGTGSAVTGPVAMSPGAHGWFELSYPDRCYQVLSPGAAPTGGPNVCYLGSWLQVTPPRTTSPLLVTEPVRFTYGTSGFQVGPFQPAPLPRTLQIAA